ncbi:response regulator transcription factor [Cohnella yongneupensis]|uniref:Response regulator transcription factor n=1 Tax=Cohnella yongneupensis TaxID=425006 RepID=A0ABW0R4D4_9BACL
MHILIVEDEVKIREVLVAYFENEGWKVDFTEDGHEAVRKFDYEQHDLVILDLMINGLPGEEVCRKVREKSKVPIIMLTSKSKENDVMTGFHLGADDYVVKPFRVKELVARIHALFRRVHTEPEQATLVSYDKGKLVVNFDTKEAYLNSAPVNLTSTEFKLLSVLCSKPGKVHHRNELYYHVQGYRYKTDGRTIDTHIKNLRRKIEEDSKEPKYILTMVGSGYKFAFRPDA